MSVGQAAQAMILNGLWWVTRVSLTLKTAQTVLAESGPVVEEPESEGWEELAPDYQGREYESEYGGVKQRWLVVFSQVAYGRESKTFARKLAKAEARAQSALAKLAKQTFACRPDAEQALAKVASK